MAVALACIAAAPATASAKPLKRGAHGARVIRLQHLLHIHADGVFGPGTARAVRRFQRRHRLTADGIVGPATWRALLRTAGATSGGRRGAVRLLQQRLGIGADGVFGAQTARAVKHFQAAHGLTADGIVGPATWRALGLGGRGLPVVRRGAGRHRTRHSSSSIPAAVRRVIAAANRIARKPYVYGGGHRSWNAAGYDCSGSVSYALHGGGLLRAPLDSGELMHYGVRGPGRFITIYASPGHAFMTVLGRRFDTTGRWITGSRWQRTARTASGYVVRHPRGL